MSPLLSGADEHFATSSIHVDDRRLGGNLSLRAVAHAQPSRPNKADASFPTCRSHTRWQGELDYSTNPPDGCA